MVTDTPEEMAETLTCVLDGTMGLSLKDMRWPVRYAFGEPCLYVCNGSGEWFMLTVEPCSEANVPPD